MSVADPQASTEAIPAALAESETPSGFREAAAAYLELTKPGITLFVMVTAAAAYTVAAVGAFSPSALFHVALGSGLATAGALALNQYLERRQDGLMIRTRGRPIPSGRLPAHRAGLFGLALVVAGVGHLWFWLGALPALLTLISAVLYDGVYTPMKLRSPLATPVGAIPGAMPALIGWTAHAGTIDIAGLSLFGILFFWQLIHVLALAWNLEEDYQRAGFQLIPRGSSRLISVFMVGYAAVLLPVSLSPTALGLTGLTYLVGAAILGLGMVMTTLAFLVEPTRSRCHRVFFASLVYHPLLLGLMVLSAF